MIKKNCYECGKLTQDYETIKRGNNKTKYYCKECVRKFFSYWGDNYAKKKS